MARLSPLLAMERVAAQRATEDRSGAERLVEWCAVAMLALVLLGQLKAIAMGPLGTRRFRAEMVLLALCALWILLPLTRRPSLSLEGLRLYPLTAGQRVGYSIGARLQHSQMLGLPVASLALLCTLFRVPHPLSSVALASAALIGSGVAGFAVAMLPEAVSGGDRSGRSKVAGRSVSYPLPLFRKELQYFARLLDPWLGLAISAAAGYSEVRGEWMTPAKTIVPVLLIVIVQLPAVVNPFGLDEPGERERYGLLPLPFWRIVLAKHAALKLLVAMSLAPLALSLVWRMTSADSVASLLLVALVPMSLFATGLALLGTRSARRVRLSAGGLSGEGMSLLLALQAGGMVCAVPVAVVLAAQLLHGRTAQILLELLSCTLLLGSYVWRIRNVVRPDVS